MKRKTPVILVLLLTAAFGFSTRNYFENDSHRISSAESYSHWTKARPETSQLHSGDLIFRHGKGFISKALMSFGRTEKKYSHAGIVAVENGNVFVYHAIGGEENKTNKLRKDPLEVFCNPADVYAFGIYRTDINPDQIKSVIEISDTYYKSGLEFDTKFDLSTDDKMYCTEFVYKVFEHAAGNQNYIYLPTLTGKKYITCDDLYCNSRCREIYQYHY